MSPVNEPTSKNFATTDRQVFGLITKNTTTKNQTIESLNHNKTTNPNKKKISAKTYLNNGIINQSPGQEKFLVTRVARARRRVAIGDHRDDVDPQLAIGVPVRHLVVLAGDNKKSRQCLVDLPLDRGSRTAGTGTQRHFEAGKLVEGHPVARDTRSQVDGLAAPELPKLRQPSPDARIKFRASHGGDALATVELNVLRASANSYHVRLKIIRETQMIPEKPQNKTQTK